MPAGVTIRFETDAKWLAVVAKLGFVYTPPRSPPLAAMDLEVDGKLYSATHRKGDRWLLDSKQDIDIRRKRGPIATFRFRHLPAGRKRCTLWLPHNVIVEVRTLQANSGAQFWPSAADRRASWLHYGSSISHSMEATQPTGTWPAVAARRADRRLYNFSFAGQCHLDPFVARSIAAQPADLISLKVGINIVASGSLSRRTFAPAVLGFLDTIRDKQPDTPILLISPIYRPNTEPRPPSRLALLRRLLTGRPYTPVSKDRLTMEHVREALDNIARLRRAQGDVRVDHLDGCTLFGPEDARHLLDDVHPNANGYRIIGERFANLLSERYPPVPINATASAHAG